MGGCHMATSHWSILSMCRQTIRPPVRYNYMIKPDHLANWTCHITCLPRVTIWGRHVSTLQHVRSFYNMYGCHMSPLQWWHMSPWPLWLLPSLTQTLIIHNFCIRTPFEAIFESLESYRWALHIDGVFESIWDNWILGIYESFWTSVSVPDAPGFLWVFWILLDQESPQILGDDIGDAPKRHKKYKFWHFIIKIETQIIK